MMKKIHLTLLFCIGVIPFIAAQNKTIKGRIFDNENSPINEVTIVLQTIDSTYLDVQITDSLGLFKFESTPTQYRLIIQHILYEPKIIESDKKDLKDIILSRKDFALDEITITAERPFVKVTDGKLAYDLQQITQKKIVSNAYEALLSIPGVYEQNGKINLSGMPEVTIILNNKPTTLNADQLIELLKQMPASALTSAEVMYSTPPEYHVRGSSINLTMHDIQPETQGSNLQGQINGAYNQKHYANYSLGASLLYSTSKLSIDFLYGFSNYNERTGMDIYSQHQLDGQIHDISQFSYGKRTSLQHTSRIGLDYKLSKGTVSLAYNTFITPSAKNREYSFYSSSNSINRVEKENQLHNVAMDYIADSGFKMGADYTFYKAPLTQDLLMTQENKEFGFLADAQQKIHHIMVYVDNKHTLNKNWELTYGTQFSYAKDHDYQFYNQSNGNLTLYDTDNTLKEYIYNLYIGVNKQFSEKLSGSISLTTEYNKLGNDHYWTLFPQAELMYFHSPKHILQFSFSSDKTYPAYWEKQDFIGRFDSYTQIQGNPELKAFNNYSAQLNYIKDQKYVFTLFHYYQPDYFVQLAYQSTKELKLIYQTHNFDYNQVTGVSVVLPFQIGGWWNMQLVMNGMYQKSKSNHFHDIRFVNERFIGMAMLDNTFTISKKPNISMELNGMYISKPIQGIFDLSKVYNIDAGLKWTFADEKAELRFKATDLFNSSIPNMSVNRSGQHFKMNPYADERSLKLSFTYKFGGYKEKKRKEIDRSRYK